MLPPPPLQCYSSLPTENTAGSSNWRTSSSCLADTTLVHPSPSPVSRQPCSSPAADSSADTTAHPCAASLSETAETDGLQALRKSLQQRSISGKATAIILKS